MTEEDKLYADELRKRAYSDYERLNMAIDELERQTCETPRNNLEITSQDLENKYEMGYNCGYADAMSDISERR